MPTTINVTTQAQTDDQPKKVLTPEQARKALLKKARKDKKDARKKRKSEEKDKRAGEKDRMTELKEKIATERRLEKEFVKRKPMAEELRRRTEEAEMFANDLETVQVKKQESHIKKSSMESNRLGNVLHMA
eukprot:CAMPEP_0119007588 /NCGR_PEP_ID=MMETSP1176-20130426/3109_1 /TAXON_ID=265551 /ORGANISM="Synedropsis recta cf, Strain CCMP1620" /LENGTH=130 /DNA_ID=CAMNT_0006959769 /DNA_START=84 /DNA_END=476 /DNA_ORIENTATION=-